MIDSTTGDGRTFEGRETRRLWSPWDMLELNASAFYAATSTIVDIGAWLAAQRTMEDSLFREDALIDHKAREYLTDHFRKLPDHLRKLGANISQMAVQEAIDTINSTNATWRDVRFLAEEVRNSIRRELTSVTMFIIEAEGKRYYSPKESLFGVEFEKNYPSASFDLDEAAKCLALKRPMATVFHLMRLMEIGLKAVAAWLSIPPPTSGGDRNWFNILKKIKDAAAARTVDKAWKSADDRDLLDDIYASLDAVRIAWRNTTMHVEDKRTPEEAEHIFLAIKGFMKKLASRMDEDGEPKA